jgi:benzoate membrane transport protein
MASAPAPLADRGGAAPPQGSLVQPLSTGILAGVVGFASSFAIVLQGFSSIGASAAEAASGLTGMCLMQGLMTLLFSLWKRQPISIVWSTPGAALLIATGVPAGGYPAAVGAILFAALLVVAAGCLPAFGRAVGAIPRSLASAMLAGVLFGLCLAPAHAMAQLPLLTAPILLAWLLATIFVRPYAVPIVVFVTKLPPDAWTAASPRLLWVTPSLSPLALGSLGLPLFIVTMASQNVPGLAVLRANGFKPDIGSIFIGAGLGSLATTLFGGQLLNLAAVTAALCAGPDAHADPAKRYLSTVVTGMVYLLLGLAAGLAAVLVAASPPLLIQSVAGVALLGSFASALTTALAHEEERIAAMITFLVSASGLAFFGIGAAFWGLLAGGVMLGLTRAKAAF